MNQKQSKPNVILIVVDQMRADALSINRSDDLVVTPTLDMMASMGYNFENAYSPVPSCVPARAALLTGMDQEKSGRVGYEDEVPWNYTNTLPQTFKDLGYQTECIGKCMCIQAVSVWDLTMFFCTMATCMSTVNTIKRTAKRLNIRAITWHGLSKNSVAMQI